MREGSTCKTPTFDILGTENLSVDAVAANFTKSMLVFGLVILAVEGVPDAALNHSAAIVAEYVDNDEDGCPE